MEWVAVPAVVGVPNPGFVPQVPYTEQFQIIQFKMQPFYVLKIIKSSLVPSSMSREIKEPPPTSFGKFVQLTWPEKWNDKSNTKNCLILDYVHNGKNILSNKQLKGPVP